MRIALLVPLLGLAARTLAAPPIAFEATEIDPHAGNVCYAVTTADVDGDGKPDVAALTEDALIWYANPSWEKHVLLKGATEPDNVCFQPRDLDGDGRVDFALGASWQPANTQGGGTLQWAGRDDSGAWQVHPIGSEPTIHRLRWGDVKGTGRAQLVVAPLQGRGTRGPDWGTGRGARVMVYDVPEHPAKDPWPMEVAADRLHTIHNLQLVDFDADGRDEVLCAAWEGVFLLDRGADGTWTTTKLGTGNQEAAPFKGASEIKLGRLADGRRFIATIEPWHGFQVVTYSPPPDDGEGLWQRRVIDEPVTWGHAVWCADLDGDGGDELIVGQRDPNPAATSAARGPGVWVYDLDADRPPGDRPVRQVVDDGGMACEDLVAADLDGDGRPEIVAGGRATHNVKIYWNRGEAAR